MIEHFGLVYSIVRKLRRQIPFYIGREDLLSSGMLGLVEAWRAYDDTKDTHFSTYAYKRIQGSILDFLKKTDLRYSRSYRNMRETPLACFDRQYADHGDPCIYAIIDETREMILDMIDRLPDRERRVITLYYYEGLRFTEIAWILGLSKASITATHQKALSLLRNSISQFPSFQDCFGIGGRIARSHG